MSGEERRIACARIVERLAETRAARDGQRKPFARKPQKAFKRLCKAAFAALGVVQRLRVMIEADAKRKRDAEFFAEGEKPFAHARAHHRAHGVGQDQRFEPARERIARKADHLRIHERLAARKSDLARAKRFRLVKEGRRLIARDISEPVVLRARFDIAMRAFDIAERASVDPQRLKRIEGN